MARAETRADRLEAYANELQGRINKQLAALPYVRDQSAFEAIMRQMLPDDWEYVEATAIGGPRKIMITRYRRLGT
jgi:hypothetical protein